MLNFFNEYQRNFIFSQNGEEGILLEIINRLEPEIRMCFEFGCNNGQWCSNTALLIKEHGWPGVQAEADRELYLKAFEFFRDNIVNTLCCEVSPANINAIMPPNCFIASFDTDGPNDYNCLKVLTYCPDVLVIEINSAMSPMQDYIDAGANYSAMVRMGIEKGYFLLCHTGNLIFVLNKHREAFPEIIGDGLTNWQEYFQTKWIK